jgi:L-serine deaminase
VIDSARNNHLSVSQFMEKPECFKESKAKMKRFVDIIKKGYSND